MARCTNSSTKASPARNTRQPTRFMAPTTRMSETWANGSTTIQTETWNSDGTINNDHYYDVTVQTYTDYDVVYADNQRRVLHSRTA